MVERWRTPEKKTSPDDGVAQEAMGFCGVCAGVGEGFHALVYRRQRLRKEVVALQPLEEVEAVTRGMRSHQWRSRSGEVSRES